MLRHALSEILRRDNFFDPDLDGVSVTISELSVSPDLSNARVYVMPLGGENSDTVPGAEQAGAGPAAGGGAASIRRVPRLKFILDDSFENARLNVVFNSIRRDD